MSIRVYTAALAGFACGPSVSPDDGTNGTSHATDGATDTGAPTTDALADCAEVSLPQALPTGGSEPLWRWQQGNVSVRFMDPLFICGEDLKCPNEYGPGLLGYFVVLAPEYQSPGIYPIGGGPSPGLAGVQVSALFIDSGCNISSASIARDGVVEVLAIDSQCVAIDIRGVTSALYGLDPNGSGRAPLCDPEQLAAPNSSQ